MALNPNSNLHVKTIELNEIYQHALKALLPTDVKKEHDLLFTKKDKIKLFYEEGEQEKI